jgi:hypothetical protein
MVEINNGTESRFQEWLQKIFMNRATTRARYLILVYFFPKKK